MHVFVEIGPLKAYLKHQRSNHSSIGLVPTMGALHQGHMRLVHQSKKENSITVCSIYINPVQFNNQADLEKYPRTLKEDILLLEETGCDAVFCPDSSEMYPDSSYLSFDFGALDKILEGEFRRGHFSGVALVVSKLFNIIKPDRAYFGQKDFQQFKVISRLVAELKFDVSLVCVPIVREADGLAMSSRNARLNPGERVQSKILYQCLNLTRERLMKGEPFLLLQKEMTDHFNQNKLKLEYLALADSENLTLLENVKEPKQAILLIAAFIGEVRLIDNLYVIENKS